MDELADVDEQADRAAEPYERHQHDRQRTAVAEHGAERRRVPDGRRPAPRDLLRERNGSDCHDREHSDEGERRSPPGDTRGQGADRQAQEVRKWDRGRQQGDGPSSLHRIGQVARRCERRGHDDGATDPVDDTRDEQQCQGRCDRAARRRRREDRQPEQEREPTSAPVRQRAEDRRENRHRKGVGAGNEANAGDRLVKVVGECRQNRGDDVRVDAHDEDTQAEEDGGGHRLRVARVVSRRSPAALPSAEGECGSAGAGLGLQNR